MTMRIFGGLLALVFGVFAVAVEDSPLVQDPAHVIHFNRGWNPAGKDLTDRAFMTRLHLNAGAAIPHCGSICMSIHLDQW